MSGENQVGPGVERSLWGRVVVAGGVLTAAMGTGLLLAAGCGWLAAGAVGVAAAVVAFSVCWAPNLLSLMLLGVFRESQQSSSVILVGMLLRMAPPLLLGLGLLQSRHWLVDAGVLPMMLAMYLLSLVAETVLSLWVVGAFRQQPLKKVS